MDAWGRRLMAIFVLGESWQREIWSGLGHLWQLNGAFWR